MKLRSHFSVAVQVAAILVCGILVWQVTLWLSGCDVIVNENWNGFGNIHPFPEPLVVNHSTYLHDHLDPLGSCRDCHGSDYSGGISGRSCLTCHTQPGGPEACGTCHAMPPPSPHPALSLCYLCHGSVVDANTNIINTALHIDGVVQVNLESNHPFGEPFVENHTGYLRDHLFPLDVCKACHGDDYAGGISEHGCLECHTYLGGPEACNTCHGNYVADPSLPVNQAPPVDVARNASTDSIGVGAHSTHMTGRLYTDGIPCHDCHQVPSAWNSPGHIDPLPAEVVFGGISVLQGANPVWDRQSRTCTDTYCHRPGAPIWTVVDGTQAVCGACHHIPPAPPHTQSPTIFQCYICHGAVIDSTGRIIHPDLHVDGTIE